MQAGRTVREGRRLRDGAVAAVASFLLALASAAAVDPATGDAALWLPAGAALGALAVLPPRRWPAVVAGAACGSLAADLAATGGDLALAGGWTLANVAMWLAGGALARRLAGGVPDLRRSAHVGVLVLAAAGGPAVGALVGGLVSHLHHGAPLAATAWAWWPGDWTAALAIAPLALTVRRADRPALARLAGAGLASAAVAAAVSTSGLPLGALVVLPVVAAGGLLGPAGAAIAGAAAALVVLPSALAGGGPFVAIGPGAALAVGQVWVSGSLLAGLLVAVLATGRDRSYAALAEREGRYRAVVDNLAEGLVVHDADGAVANANPAALAILGVDLASFVGMSPADPRWRAVDVDGRDLPTGAHPVVEALATGRAVRSRVIGVPLDTGVRWLSVSAQPLPREHGGGVVSLFVDVSEQRRVLAALRDAEERFRAAFETAPVGVVLVALDGTCLDVNAAFAALVGRPPDDLVRRDFCALADREDAARDLALFDDLLAGRRASVAVETRYRRPDGEVRWGDVRIALVRDAAGIPAYAVAQAADVTDRRAAHDALAHRATHDVLTGLADRGVVRERLGEALHGPSRTTVGVLFVDLDDFKGVNDLHGHEVGDDVLTVVAQRLAAAVREEDLVGRLGGDEFVVVCDGVDADALRALAGRVADSVAGPIATRAGALLVTASVGWALAGETASAEEVLDAADRDMYTVKRGRPRAAS